MSNNVKHAPGPLKVYKNNGWNINLEGSYLVVDEASGKVWSENHDSEYDAQIACDFGNEAIAKATTPNPRG